MSKDNPYDIKAAWICIIGFAIFRLWYSHLFQLAPDETNYWQWGRHLAWGYHDQAPMLGWVIRLSTLFFGDSETAVRLPSILAMTVVAVYLLKIADHWFSPKIAFGTVILCHSILEFNIGGLLATPDGLQAAAWAGAGYHVARAYEEDTWFQWISGGLWFGFGMLSKFTMVVFLPCAFLYGLNSGLHRKRLTGIKPYIGAFLGSMLFAPVIFWNATHHWNSLRHVAFIGGANESFALHWKFLGDFFLSQAGLLSPLVFILVLLAWILAVKKRKNPEQWIYSYLFFTSFPMVAGFACLSLHTRIYGNWPGAGYVTACALGSALFVSKSGPGETFSHTLGKKMWPWAVITSFLLTVLVLTQVIWRVFPIPLAWDRTSTELRGWRELGQMVGEMKNQMPRPETTFLFGLRYQTSSELAFYTPGQPDTVSINKWKRPNVYDYWITDNDIIGWDAVGVTDSPDSHVKTLNQVFQHVDPPRRLEIYRDRIWFKNDSGEKPVKSYYIYKAYDFKGGLAWQPPDSRDIRVYRNSSR